MSTPTKQPIMRPGTPIVASVLAGNADAIATHALNETESEAPPFVPSIANNPVAVPTPTPVPVPVATVTAAVDPAKADGSTPKAEILTPAERWQKLLASAGITEQDAYAILDAVIQKGYWEKEYRLWNGRVKCVFRTRDAHHLMRVRQSLEDLSDRSEFSVSQTIFRVNTAGSLSSYQNVVLPAVDIAKASVEEIENAYVQRYNFIGKLPAPIFEQMYVALAHFDAVVTAATSEGAAQGF